jgi:integrase/recombinase XerD
MTALSQRLNEYLSVRRSLGYDLSFAARVLRGFAAFADQEGTEYITVDLFLRWKDAFGATNNDTWSVRLGMVRGFAGWLQTSDTRTEVPPSGLIAGKPHRTRPHIYSDAEVSMIVARAAMLPSRYGLRGWTCSTLFGLIAITGLRINEALGLDDDDVDLGEGVVTIRRGKNGKARFVPVDPSCVAKLRAYRVERMRLLGVTTGAFFRIDDGQRPTDCCARYNFAQVSQEIGLREAERYGRHGRGPRIHDLRHTFAVRTIIGWYRSGADPDREMIRLSTYLGHSKPDNTYWYIEAVPELLQMALERAERSLAEGATP